jgi:hypothetical protein
VADGDVVGALSQRSGGPGLFRVEGKRRACPVVC